MSEVEGASQGVVAPPDEEGERKQSVPQSKWSFTVARIAGTAVRIHFTFLILLVWLFVEFSRAGGISSALGALALYLGLFFCVLLHEFGHVAAARFFGVRTPVITLLPIGGLAQLERIPKNPVAELVIAMAGPLVNVLIVLVLWIVTRAAPNLDPLLDLNSEVPIPYLQSIMGINVILALFNMIPAFPMDGGRVLRALLGFVMPWEGATRCAARIGQVFALCGGLLALFMHNPILLLIAAFIFFAAGSEQEMARVDGLLEGVTVSDAAISHFESLGVDARIGEAVALLLDGSQRDFPVVDESRSCVGVLTRENLIRGLSGQGPAGSVTRVMETNFPSFKPEAPVAEAFGSMSQLGLGAAPVVGRSGEVEKWLTLDNISEVLMTRAAVARR